ncbi:uncharacterized protein LOC134821933 isoform X2 [Bolinopsis microptera]|uniref:uncharacterized protein LOC134821933 isoform X2 n=1 Tax=Bolinopsis microptera TaxID=2820187 RepID=UPI00307A7EE6
MGGCLVLITWLVIFLTSDGNIIQQGVPYQGTIKPYETQQIIFASGGGLKRVFYFQCTGSADLSIVDSSKKELQMFKGFVSKSDGDCEESYDCNGDPCESASCPSSPNAECISNYCEGCIAEFWLDNEQVTCQDPGTAGNSVISKGAPLHKAVLSFSEIKYTFNLLGKRSSIDSTNTFQLYVFDNYAVDASIIMLGPEAEVFVQVQESNVTLEWTEPVYGFAEDILQHYCLYSLDKPYGKQLEGDWLACGHEIKSSVADNPDQCVTTPKATFHGLAGNRSHYFWVVAFSQNGISTAYPFVRVDMEGVPESRTYHVTYSILLVILSVFFVVDLVF